MIKIRADEIIANLVLKCIAEPKETEAERVCQVIDILVEFVEFDNVNETIDGIILTLHNRLKELGE